MDIIKLYFRANPYPFFYTRLVTQDQKNTDKQIISNDRLRQFRELKDDQIRIVYRYLSDNKVLIIVSLLGMFEFSKSVTSF